MVKKTYLGDGLYASFDGWQISLTAEDGIRVTNEVFLEPEVLSSFLRFIENAYDKTIIVKDREETKDNHE